MGASGKAEAVLEWAKGWPDLDGYLKLNAITNQEGDAALNVVNNDLELQRYIDGSSVRQFTLQLRIMTAWSDGYDSVNAEAEALASSWQDWVSEQYGAGNVPAIGNVTAIEPVWNVPSLNYINEDEGLAEYIVQAVVIYEE